MSPIRLDRALVFFPVVLLILGVPSAFSACDHGWTECAGSPSFGNECLIDCFKNNEAAQCNGGNGEDKGGPVPDGTACTGDGIECTDDVCADGVCTHPDSAAGTPCEDTTDDDCRNPDTCDGGGLCLANDEADGTTCTDDGNDCTADQCSAGACDHTNLAAGTACGDATDDDCVDPDTCNGGGICLANDEADGTACTDDGNDCTGDQCLAGVCDHPALPTGTACGDPTDDECRNPDTCGAGGLCLANDEADGTACGDATDDECRNPDTCDAGGVCLSNDEPDGTGCTDDGVYCTSDECLAGICDHSESPCLIGDVAEERPGVRGATIHLRRCIGGSLDGHLCKEDAECDSNDCFPYNIVDFTVNLRDTRSGCDGCVWSPTAAELNTIAGWFQTLNDGLFDATDGQFVLGRVLLIPDWGAGGAEIQFQPGKCKDVEELCLAHADCSVGQCGRGLGRTMSPVPGWGRPGRKIIASTGCLDPDASGPRCFVHEFMHYIMGAADEYLGGDGIDNNDNGLIDECNSPGEKTNAKCRAPDMG